MRRIALSAGIAGLCILASACGRTGVRGLMRNAGGAGGAGHADPDAGDAGSGRHHDPNDPFAEPNDDDGDAGPEVAAAPDLIRLENMRTGTTAWNLSRAAADGGIQGFTSRTSVNLGETIDLFVDTSTANDGYALEVFRIGWYGGAGARRVTPRIHRTAVHQPAPFRDPQSGLTECVWSDPYTLAIDDRETWVSGVHLAKLTADRTGEQAYVIFAVRDDARASDYLYQMSVATYQAYNAWGGRSTYASNSSDEGPATKVSFNRPYARGHGAGDFFEYEIDMVRFLERESADVTYATSIDTHANPHLFDRHRAFLSVGHDEYWSWHARKHVEAARDRGVGLGFFGANAVYWQIRLEPSPFTADRFRTLVAYKNSAADDDPLMASSRTRPLTTARWRDPILDRPEAALVGVSYNGIWPIQGDILVTGSEPAWLFDGTGLRPGDRIRGLLGFEADVAGPSSPPNLTIIAHSPVGGERGFADVAVYTSSSGATVFAAGTEQWSWGLDDFIGQGEFTTGPARSSFRHPGVEQLTRNVLARLANRR